MDAYSDARGRSGTEHKSALHILNATLPFGEALTLAQGGGFTHLLMAPPFPGRIRHGHFLPRELDRLDPKLAAEGATLGVLAKRARGAGIGLLMDVQLDRLAAGSPLAGGSASPFQPPSKADLLDPRRGALADVAAARIADASEARVLATWWAPRLRAWHLEGIGGFRLLGLDSFPGELAGAFFAALRLELPEPLLLIWAPGLRVEALHALRGLRADGVFAPVPAADWHRAQAWQELAALARIAPVIGTDLPQPGAIHPAPLFNAVLAALIGQGCLLSAPAPERALLNACAELPPGAPRPLILGSGVLAFLRLDGADHRFASRAALVLLNTDEVRSQHVAATAVLPATGGAFGPFASVLPEAGETLGPQSVIHMKPGEIRIYSAERVQRPVQRPAAADARAARVAGAAPRLAVERLSPAVDDGAFPVKAVAGETITVEADVVFDGHDKVAAALRWLGPQGADSNGEDWQEVPMRPLGNDRWQAEFPLAALGRHSYAVCAWRDRFEAFRDELAKKSAAGVPVVLEILEGTALVRAAQARSAGVVADDLHAALGQLKHCDEAAKLDLLLSPGLAGLMAQADDRPFQVVSREIPVDAERIEARFASWYEVFPRSLSDDPARHGTFRDVERHLPRIRDMGFDVLYFPPIHPIGRKNRKGRNNTLTPAADDPGSPYAIGAAEGGHDVLHPELGTLEDFARLREAAAAHGLELAMDFAIQCSPDHPWLKQHPGWFDWRPDGTIRYAENPPKKYEDIVNVDFYTKDAVPDLWVALCDVVLFWAGQGVRLFRVDNPHTKPFPFWEWMIAEVRTRYPDAIFLAEAFTRPKVMYRLAKIGFSQSYTYFTWRNSKRELEEYLTELDSEAPKDFFRPHFFVNTPDINPVFLQTSGRPGFLIRAALAATLSGLWGVYNGFELCEAAAMPGKEEYADSEKYQLRAWDWDRPGNIVAEVTALNRIRRENPALQTHLGVRFLVARNDAILYYEKATPDRRNVVLVAVSLDPYRAQEADFEVPLWSWSLPDQASLEAENLETGERFTFYGKNQHVRLTPEKPYLIWRVWAG